MSFRVSDDEARLIRALAKRAKLTLSVSLANIHQAELATLDAGIPGAFLVPDLKTT